MANKEAKPSEEKLCFRCNRPDHDGMCESGPSDTQRLIPKDIRLFIDLVDTAMRDGCFRTAATPWNLQSKLFEAKTACAAIAATQPAEEPNDA